jgi:hypothetical protein
VAVLPNTGGGTFGVASRYSIQQGSDAGNGLASIDLRGDGRPDLVVSAFLQSVRLRNNGNGTFQNTGPFPTVHDPGWMDVSDVNGDGKPDLIVISRVLKNWA